MKLKYSLAFLIVQTLMISAISMTVHAADIYQDQAKKLVERLSSTKVPAGNPLVAQVAAKLRTGDLMGAAALAETHPNFLNTTVKLMALKMSTKDETFGQPLNDFAASFIGVTRDEIDARQLLTGNFYYMADPTKIPAGVTVRSDLGADILGSNNHYADLENPLIDVGAVLKKVNGQMLIVGASTVVNGVTSPAPIAPNPDPAGVLTSRAFMMSQALGGTNRRIIQYTFQEFMCVPIAQWADASASDQRIGRDIDRFPGGNGMVFQTTCKACHTQMDSFRGAFAYYDIYGNHLSNSKANIVSNIDYHTDGHGVTDPVAIKMNKNNTMFPGGYVMTDNSWVNNSQNPANAALFGWRGNVVSSGMGANSFATAVANSKRFSQCMVKHVYDAVCRTNLDPAQNMTYLQQQATQFEQGGYDLKKLFQSVAISPSCAGN